MKNISAVLLLLLAFGLAGCSNPASTSTDSPFTPAAERSAALTPVPSAPAYAMESLLANSAYWISNRVRGKNGSDTNGIRTTFSSMKWTLESNWPITRNTNCWLHGVKGLTAISPFNRQAAYQDPGTAVSPRHIV